MVQWPNDSVTFAQVDERAVKEDFWLEGDHLVLQMLRELNPVVVARLRLEVAAGGGVAKGVGGAARVLALVSLSGGDDLHWADATLAEYLDVGVVGGHDQLVVVVPLDQDGLMALDKAVQV